MKAVARFFRKHLQLKNRTGTVRYMFPALLSFVAMLGAAVITSNNVSYVKLSTPNATIEAGKAFSIDVFAFAHVPVNAIDITLEFDSKVVEVVSVDRGRSVLTIWTKEPTIKNGMVTLVGGTFKKGFLDEHLIATVNLKAKKTGQSTFKVASAMLLAGDGKGSTVKVSEAKNSSINLYVYDENTDPSSIGVDVKISIITDIDGDGKVTLKDISAFMAAWHKKNILYDFNGDGKMTFRDFSIILANFLF